eukprot:5036945-Pleurochrysis_carterae.AAC.2
MQASGIQHTRYLSAAARWSLASIPKIEEKSKAPASRPTSSADHKSPAGKDRQSHARELHPNTALASQRGDIGECTPRSALARCTLAHVRATAHAARAANTTSCCERSPVWGRKGPVGPRGGASGCEG